MLSVCLQIPLSSYHFLIQLALNYRIQMIIFIEEVLDEVIRFYSFAMDDETKAILFKILHISLVIHAPHAIDMRSEALSSDEFDNMLKISTAGDNVVWFKQMRGMLSIVEKEINEMRKQLAQRSQVPTISAVFVDMAAKLCSMVKFFFLSNALLKKLPNEI